MRVRLIVLAVLVMAPVVAGDEITLKNGDKLTGKIVRMMKGKLTLDSPHAGKVTVPWDQIASIKSDEPVPVRLVTGEVIKGKLSMGEGGMMRIETEGAPQPVDVEMAKVTHLRDPGVAWHGSMDFGANANDGNTNDTNIIFTAEAIRESEIDKWTLRAIYKSSVEDSTLTKRYGYGLGKYQYFVFEDGYAFGTGEAFHDRFADLRLRSILAAGVGYQLFKGERMSLSGEAGFAYIDNNYYEDEDESHAGARLNLLMRAELPLGFDLIEDFTWYPNFEDTANWVIHNELSVATSVGIGWTFKVGWISDVVNEPAEGREENDNTYFVSLGYRF